MSAKVMGGVFDLDLTPAQQIVLLAYADHADHFGKNVFPSKRLIAWKTGYGLRQVQRITDQLVSLKIMKVEQVKAGKSIKYSIDLSKGKKKPPFEEGVRQNVTPDIAMSSEGRQNVTPTHDMPVPDLHANHQDNHHIEPSHTSGDVPVKFNHKEIAALIKEWALSNMMEGNHFKNKGYREKASTLTEMNVTPDELRAYMNDQRQTWANDGRPISWTNIIEHIGSWRKKSTNGNGKPRVSAQLQVRIKEYADEHLMSYQDAETYLLEQWGAS